MYPQKALFVTLLTTPSPSTRIRNPTKIYFPCATESLCVLLLISHEKPWYARALGAIIGSGGMRGLDPLCNSRRWGRGAVLAVDRSCCWYSHRHRRGVTQRAGLGSGFLPSQVFCFFFPPTRQAKQQNWFRVNLAEEQSDRLKNQSGDAER